MRLENSTPGLRWRLLAVLAAAFVGLAGTALAQPADDVRIAVVDLEAVVAGSPEGQSLQKKLESFQAKVRGEADAINQRANDIRQRMAEGANSLSDDKLSELQKQYEDAQIELRRLRDDRTREGQKMQEDGLRSIEQQLAPIFKAVQEDLGYDLILNNVPGVVVMANEKVDITPLVIERLAAAAGGGQAGSP